MHSIFVAMCPAAGKHRSEHFHSRGSRLHVVAFVRCAHIACHRCLMNFFFHSLFQTGHPIVPVIPGRSVAIGKLVLLLFVLIGFDCMASLASTVLPLSWPHTYWVCSRGIRPVGVGEDPREPRIQYNQLQPYVCRKTKHRILVCVRTTKIRSLSCFHLRSIVMSKIARMKSID